MDRLGEVEVCTAFVTQHFFANLGTRCGDDDAHGGVQLTQAFGQAESVFLRQVQVNHINIGGKTARNIVDFFSRRHPPDVMPLRLQKGERGGSEVIVVLDH